MFVVYTFCVVVGVLFAALSWLRVSAGSAHADGAESPGATGESRRAWALPLAVFGLVGLTLHLLDRPFLHTLLLSLLVGPPVGLIGGWVSRRINGD